MTTLSTSAPTRVKRLRANWAALLLPVPVAGLYGCLGFVAAYYLPRGYDTWWVRETAPWLGLSLDYVLPVTFLIMIVAVGLLVLTGAPGSNAVRRAAHQVFGTGGQPRTVPALLLLPVIGLWEESCAGWLWFGSVDGQQAAILIVAVGVALVAWRPQLAGILAVLGLNWHRGWSAGRPTLS